jgi:hypothetical protein
MNNCSAVFIGCKFVLNIDDALRPNMDISFTVAAFDNDCISVDLTDDFFALTSEVLHFGPPFIISNKGKKQIHCSWCRLIQL